jgi:hypothetical protein
MSAYFAYGSNISAALMRRRCPGAVALGPAELPGWRFCITRDGFASVVPEAGGLTHGVLWRLAPRDLAALNAYESLDSGLYGRRILPIIFGGVRRPALVYVARERRQGRPAPGYLALVVQAARDWRLPAAYIRSLERRASSAWTGARRAEPGEVR